MQLDKVVTAFDERLVCTRARLTLARQLTKATRFLGIGYIPQLETQIPDIPVVHAPIGVLLAAVALVEDDTRIRPDGAGELVVEAGCHQGPFAAKRMSDDADTI